MGEVGGVQAGEEVAQGVQAIAASAWMAGVVTEDAIGPERPSGDT